MTHNSTFRKAPPPRPPRTPLVFAPTVTTVRRVPPAITESSGPLLKTPNRKNQAIRDSARDEECQVRIVGACNHDKATTVWSHFMFLAAGRGMGIKSIDEAGAYSCSGCHDVVDGRRRLPPGASTTSIMLDWYAGHMRSLVILKQKGLL